MTSKKSVSKKSSTEIFSLEGQIRRLFSSLINFDLNFTSKLLFKILIILIGYFQDSTLRNYITFTFEVHPVFRYAHFQFLTLIQTLSFRSLGRIETLIITSSIKPVYFGLKLHVIMVPYCIWNASFQYVLMIKDCNLQVLIVENYLYVLLLMRFCYYTQGLNWLLHLFSV